MKDMHELAIPETTITPEQYSVNARQLVAAILLQATRDYCRTNAESSHKEVIRSLRSSHMDFISNGMSIIVAEQLEKNGDEIKARLIKEEAL